ncbi:alpha/beta hydrolase [Kineococcus sp. G2]|uniref:alpha/beta hydrolase n=1 Tax=Kineococcus sp. G2 TaxID=3127484 RepID=UPI00301CEC45
MLTRRGALSAAGCAAVAALVPGCTGGPDPAGRSGSSPGAGRHPAALTARPGPGGGSAPPGERALGVADVRDALLLVPPGLPPGEPVALVLTLHGAGGDAAGGLAPLRPLAEEHALVLLAPASRGSTWDAITGGYGVDAELVDRALTRAFATVAVDPGRVAVAGFSDGASYALGLGLANGELFRRVVAFSPGFVPDGPRVGRPDVHVSHGDDDEVLPVDRTSRRIVPALRAAGYDVTYREFDGPHVVPPEVAREAAARLSRPSAAASDGG